MIRKSAKILAFLMFAVFSIEALAVPLVIHCNKKQKQEVLADFLDDDSVESSLENALGFHAIFTYAASRFVFDNSPNKDICEKTVYLFHSSSPPPHYILIHKLII